MYGINYNFRVFGYHCRMIFTLTWFEARNCSLFRHNVNFFPFCVYKLHACLPEDLERSYIVLHLDNSEYNFGQTSTNPFLMPPMLPTLIEYVVPPFNMFTVAWWTMKSGVQHSILRSKCPDHANHLTHFPSPVIGGSWNGHVEFVLAQSQEAVRGFRRLLDFLLLDTCSRRPCVQVRKLY